MWVLPMLGVSLGMGSRQRQGVLGWRILGTDGGVGAGVQVGVSRGRGLHAW